MYTDFMQRTVEFDAISTVENSPRTVLVHGREVKSIIDYIDLNATEIMLNNPLSHRESDELYLGKCIQFSAVYCEQDVNMMEIQIQS